MVDIIDIGFRVDKLDKIFYNFNNVFFGEDLDVGIDLEVEFLVDTETSHVTEVVATV